MIVLWGEAIEEVEEESERYPGYGPQSRAEQKDGW